MKIKGLFIVCLVAACSIFGRAYAHSDGNFIHADLFETLQEGDKAALLMVHFGTTHDDTRQVTIDAINQKAKAVFSNLDVYEAYTSRIIIRRLAKRNVKKLNPIEMLAKLKAEGYTHILIQSTNIIDGVEMDALREDVRQMRPLFKEIRIGNPLLYTPEDYRKVCEILLEKGKDGCATLIIGHGTYLPATAQYAMLDYMLKAEGNDNFFVGTVEGYPSFEDAVNEIKKNKKLKEIQLMPFMFVAGDHAKNDIAGDMKAALEKDGYKVSVRMEGLGQDDAIQQLFIDHIQFMIKHKMVDITEKKKDYAKGKAD